MQNLEDNSNFGIQTALKTEKEFKAFKKWLKGHLNYGPVTVTFVKKDGTERVMNCTTNSELVPVVPVLTEEVAVPKKEKKKNDDVMAVFDLEVKEWRSFRWDSIKRIEFTL
jgi:WYL_2, Sm-like SH3 beta-barrel fold